MKTFFFTALLVLGGTLAFAQTPGKPAPFSELEIGYQRETFKMRDLQASPMRYYANLNGLCLQYNRLTLKNQWHVGIRARVGDLVAPGLGIRGFKFSPEQEQPLWLVPTLYRGQLTLDYLRSLRTTARRSTWLGLGLYETMGYADGLALSTWAFNSAELRVLYQTRLTLGQRHTLNAGAALPVLAAVSRMPYSNVVSEPNRSEVASFFGGTRWATLNRYLSPEVKLDYRFVLNRRIAFGLGYRYQWMRYPEPRTIRTADHTLHASLLYQFQKRY